MAIRKDKIIENIIRQFPDIGINLEASGEESHTVKLVRAIVDSIIEEITTNAEVTIHVVNTTGVSSAPGSPEVHTGTGQGYPGSIS